MLAAAPIVVCGISLPVGSCRIQIIPAGVFQTGIAINVIAAPRIFWQFLKQLIPASGVGIVLRLRHQRLQSLLCCWKKSVHALVQLQLCLDRLDVRLNVHAFVDRSRISEFRSRDSQYRRNQDQPQQYTDTSNGQTCDSYAVPSQTYISANVRQSNMTANHALVHQR